MRVRLSAALLRVSPFSLSFASRKASTGWLPPPPGTAGRLRSTKAHQDLSSSVTGRSSSLRSASRRCASSSVTAVSGMGAPAMIHLRRTSICSSASLPPGGMNGLTSWVTSFQSQLPCRLAPVTAAPRSPPRRIFSRVRRSSPDCWMAAPWHIWQFSVRMDVACSARSEAVANSGTAASNATIRKPIIQSIVTVAAQACNHLPAPLAGGAPAFRMEPAAGSGPAYTGMAQARANATLLLRPQRDHAGRPPGR